MTYDIWVVSDLTGNWEQHTRQPFTTKKAAMEWAHRYIPEASVEVRPR